MMSALSFLAFMLVILAFCYILLLIAEVLIELALTAMAAFGRRRDMKRSTSVLLDEQEREQPQP